MGADVGDDAEEDDSDDPANRCGAEVIWGEAHGGSTTYLSLPATLRKEYFYQTTEPI